MKKSLILGMVLCLLGAMVMGCPGPGPNDPPQNRLSADAAASTVKSDLNEQGYSVNVFVQDFDKNGTSDYGVEYVAGNEDKDVILLIAFVTHSVGTINKSLNWQSDKVFVLIGEDLYFASTSDCQRCSALLGNASDQEIDNFANCIFDTWKVVRGEESASGEEGEKVEGNTSDVWK